MGSAPFSYLTHLECGRCGRRYDSGVPQGLCECGSPLLARYDLPAVAAGLDRAELSTRVPSLWRYHELLPVQAPGMVVTLGEGMTPLVPLPRLAAEFGIGHLAMKDEGLLPTGTFKARGAAVGVSRARELGIRRIAMPTNGNAGRGLGHVRGPGRDGRADRDAGRRPGDHQGRVRHRRAPASTWSTA